MTTFLQAQMPSTSALFSAYASVSALAMLLRSIFHEFIPQPLRTYLLNLFHRLFKSRSNNLTLVFEDVNATGIGRNQLYDASELFLSTKITTPSTDRLKISKSTKDKTLTFRFEKGEQITDTFDGITLHWRFQCQESPKHRTPTEDDPSVSTSSQEIKFFELTFQKHYKSHVLENYIPHVLATSKSLKDENKTLKLCTLGSRFSCGNVYWDTINLEHPSTFDTLAMDPVLKSAIKADLDRFVRRREFYKRVGRAWKRGYLLYGPPGTGKSSLVAAMANHLRFDVYDLQLGNLIRDSDLRRLLLATANRSILVIEDIDCSVQIKNRENYKGNNSTDHNNGQFYKPPEVQLTLSGLLNFIDGLWSSCGDERIIVFTTNHKDKLDPALLRPGRMDMHIHMSYLTVHGFRLLASNYLQIDGDHRLFGEINRLIETLNVTPAQVAEELMRFEDADEALQGVIEMLLKMKDMMINKEITSDDKVENGHVDGSNLKKVEGQNGHFEGLNVIQNGVM
ncbi:hypothetical protein RND81_11G208900 [Saponaria officinalis]|uniref:AAA+ ATPase domain-containing protein n=1 Tax=Saponaria officinalis TaxID=3572 RepID=A0AAW1HPR5_SAPOF